MSDSTLAIEIEKLVAAARSVAARAYAPYSHFRVGAAVLSGGGVHIGTNIENSSYGLGLCAERAALSAAVATGNTNIRAIAVSCIDGHSEDIAERVPCGACRQWIAELCPDATLIIDVADRFQLFSLRELLPLAFTLGKQRFSR